jgi:hypothetical protein
MKPDVLVYDDPGITVDHIPHATLGEDGMLYHLGRYAPHGLYGSEDPAERPYNGVKLKERCKELEDKTTALAVLVEINGGLQ